MTALALMTDEEVAAYRRNRNADDASFGRLETARGALPLVALRVRARVTGVIAATEVVQTFANTTGDAIEATYIFPLPDRAAVHRFRMEVGGRVIDGVVDERGAAREQYDQAIRAGHRAAIGEEERSGVFSLRVGNLMPGERATITLSLVGPLPVDDGEVTFQFPLVVAPRYIPGAAIRGEQAGLGDAADTDRTPDASRISPPVRLPGLPNPVQLAIEIAFDGAVGAIGAIASSLHAVDDSAAHGRVIKVQPGERLDRDFILRWRADGAELASSLVCADDADGKAGTFVLSLMPPSTRAVAQKPRDVVFVIDRSGSMEGWKMVAARRAVARMVDTLTSRDRFCALAFDDQIQLLPDGGLVDATDRARFRAVEQLAKIEARGGTELRQPLVRATGLLAGGYADRERVIVLVTDGQVGNEDEILRELADKLRNVRMFTLGIDQAVNAGFLRRLAAAGAGLCELVESEDRLDDVMAKVHRRIGAPVASELSLRAVGGLHVEPASLAPGRLPDVYAGAPVVVFGRYRGSAPANAAVELAGTSFGDPYRATVARAAGEPSAWTGPSGWLGASWARARIRDLEDRYAAGERQHEPDVVAVSKQFSVLSRFTAFLAVDRSQVVNPGGDVQRVVQAVDLPAGWETRTAAFGGPAPGGGFGAAYSSASAPAGAPMAPMAPMPAMSRAAPSPSRSAPPVMAAAEPLEAELDMFQAEEATGASAVVPKAEAAKKSPAPAPMSKTVAMPQQAMPPPQSMPTPAPASPPAMPGKLAKKVSLHRSRGDDDGRERGESAPMSSASYRTALAELADELAKATGALALRVVRQRLTEWVEDVRSVGGLDALAAEVDKLVKRLSASLDDATAKAVAAELAAIAKRGDGAPPPAKKRGFAFWK